MKTFTVIPSDNAVVIDRIFRSVDCSAVDPTIHAIQWNEEKQKGHIEYVDDDPDDGQRPPNMSIDNIDDYRSLIDAWEAAAPPPE